MCLCAQLWPLTWAHRMLLWRGDCDAVVASVLLCQYLKMTKHLPSPLSLCVCVCILWPHVDQYPMWAVQPSVWTAMIQGFRFHSAASETKTKPDRNILVYSMWPKFEVKTVITSWKEEFALTSVMTPSWTEDKLYCILLSARLRVCWNLNSLLLLPLQVRTNCTFPQRETQWIETHWTVSWHCFVTHNFCKKKN